MSKKFIKNKNTAIILLVIMLISALSFAMASCSKQALDDNSELDAKISQAILEQNKERYLKGEYACESHHIYKTLAEDNKTMYYVQYVYNEYSLNGKKVERVSGGTTPAVISFTDDSDEYEVWEPHAGETFQEEMDEKFPKDIDLSNNSIPEQLDKECDTKASEHFKK